MHSIIFAPGAITATKNVRRNCLVIFIVDNKKKPSLGANIECEIWRIQEIRFWYLHWKRLHLNMLIDVGKKWLSDSLSLSPWALQNWAANNCAIICTLIIGLVVVVLLTIILLFYYYLFIIAYSRKESLTLIIGNICRHFDIIFFRS